MDPTPLNWAAVISGTIAVFVLGMLWFSHAMFGKGWATGSHDIQPPASPPILAMVVQLAGTFTLALVIGLTETTQSIGAAIAAILATALLIAGMDLFSQKTGKATLIDAGYIVAAGVLMIVAHAIL